MPDNAPGTTKALTGVDQWLYEVIPVGCRFRIAQGINQAAVFIEQAFDGRAHMRRRNGVKTGKVGKIEQRIGLDHGSSVIGL